MALSKYIADGFENWKGYRVAGPAYHYEGYICKRKWAEKVLDKVAIRKGDHQLQELLISLYNSLYEE